MDVKNITVTNSSLTAVDYIGGLIGVMNDGTIENVDFACPVKGGNTVGGFIGQMKDGSLKSISVTGKLTCTYQRTGGLVGYMEKGNVEDCSFTADLEFTNTASYANVGGMFGEIVEGTITGSYATGNVTAKKGDNVGGLVGVMKNGTIDGSYATGTVTVSENRAQHLGGLIGQVTGTVDVKDSYATGAVTGLGKNVGGLIGRLPNGTITNCYAEGNVSATNEQVGGLIGIVENGTITGCHATGTVTSSGMYGGALVGYMTKGSVTNSYATGSVTAGQESGGLIGCIGAVNVWKCYASGAVTVSGFHRVGGLIGSIAGNASVKESFATGTVGDDTKNNRGGLIGIILSGTVEISDCYTIPNMYSASYSGGFIGALDGSPGVKVRNSYTKPTFLSGNYGSKCVFSTSEVTDVIGFIGWSSVQRWRWNTADVPDGNYMGTEGTISAKAKDFKWDETIWDLSGDEPKLKWTLANN